jgi:hypothetical protein
MGAEVSASCLGRALNPGKNFRYRLDTRLGGFTAGLHAEDKIYSLLLRGLDTGRPVQSDTIKTGLFQLIKVSSVL